MHTSPYELYYFVLTAPRDLLYAQINLRVDEMIKDGLLSEVERLQKRGLSKTAVSMQGLGYKELLEYLEGKQTLQETIEQIKKDTRHFAKRQLTWFKREKQAIWFDKSEFDYNDNRLLKELLNKFPKTWIC